ncbi:coiled-coil domain-containing protein 110 isoform X2 [Ascaphus truei]|uniref:coiled-coil domain-containing protein 110 isoform X2 n=1 Tax=Ascaphus truei TaxID=8439 RepID=UPI003F59527B
MKPKPEPPWRSGDQEERARPGDRRSGDREERARPGDRRSGDREERARPGDRRSGDREERARPGDRRSGDREERARPGDWRSGDREERARPAQQRSRDPSGGVCEFELPGSSPSALEVQSEINDIFNQSIVELNSAKNSPSKMQMTSTPRCEPTNHYASLFQTTRSIAPPLSFRENQNDSTKFGMINGETKHSIEIAEEQYLDLVNRTDVDYKDCFKFASHENMLWSDLEQKNTLLSFECDEEFGDVLKMQDIATDVMEGKQLKSQKMDMGLVRKLEAPSHTSASTVSVSCINTDVNQVIVPTPDLDIKCRRKREKGQMSDGLQTAMLSLQKTNRCLNRKLQPESTYKCSLSAPHKYKNSSEDLSTCEDITSDINRNEGKHHLNGVPKQTKEETGLLEQIRKHQREKKDTEQVTCQRLEEEKAQHLENSLCKSDQMQTQVQLSQNENMSLKRTLKQLSINTQCLREENLRYKGQINKLIEDKNIIQARLIKAEQNGEECIREIRKLINTCEDLLNQRKSIQDEKSQLSIEKQYIMREVSELKMEKQQMQKEMAAIARDKDELAKLLKATQKGSLLETKERQQLESKLRAVSEETKLLKRQIEQNQIQQLKQRQTKKHSEQKDIFQLLVKIKNDKLNLDSAVKMCLDAMKISQSEQCKSCSSEEKLLGEIKGLKAKNIVLWTGFCKNGRECQLLAKLLLSLKEDNKILQAELQEHIKNNLRLEFNARRLNKERFVFNSYLQTLENQRDTLQFKLQHLGRNNVGYREQFTINPLYKKYNSSYLLEGRCHTYCELYKEVNDHQRKADIFGPEANRKIVEIRRKLEEEELLRDSSYNNTVKHSSISVSFTTSVLGDLRRASHIRTEMRAEHVEATSIIPQRRTVEHTLTHVKEIY